MASPLKCCLKKCIQGELTPSMAHVEVRAFDISTEETGHMETAWREDGEAMFHDICWKAMLDSFKIDNPFSLSPREKELVLEAKKTAEYFDSYEKVESEGARVARILKTSQYAIAFTGAGISTSAGIGDFRGKSGKWTERDREKTYGKSKAKNRCQGVSYEDLRPTYTHEALFKLMELGYIKHIISQNTDSLHRLSGIARDKISELHGNSFLEKCEKCGVRYERPFAVRRVLAPKAPPKICVHCHFDHRTGRECERKECDGYLMNTIINFGDSLEKRVLSGAEEQAKKNDLCLCLGSTLRVTPACDLVEMGQEPPRLAICNRQPTPFDKICYEPAADGEGPIGSRVYGDCDHLMREIMKHMLAPEDLQEWNEGRQDRLDEYAKQRRSPNI